MRRIGFIGMVALAGCCAVAAAATVASSGSGRVSRQGWVAAGLHGLLIHSLLVPSWNRSEVIAGTESGVYRLKGGAWRRILSAGEVWAVAGSKRPALVVAGNQDGAVFVSRDGGARWSKRVLPTASVYAVSVDPQNPRRILAGGVGAIFLSTDGGASWTRSLRLGNNACDAIVWTGSNTLAAAIVSGLSKPLPSTVYVSGDGGATWKPTGSGLPAAGVMSVLPSNRGLLAGTMGKAVWRLAPPQTTQWVRTSPEMPRHDDHGAALLSTKGGRIYVGTLGYGVWVSIDQGRHWMADSGGLSKADGSSIVLSLATNGRTLFAGTAAGVYELAAG